MQFQLFVKLLAAILVQSWPLSEATFSDAEKKKILDTHNQLRQSASPSAAAMNFIAWKNKLEHLALKAAEKCKYEHSYGGEYAGLGENIYKGKKTDPELIIFGWFSEKNNYKHDTRTCTAGRMCGHYTAVVFDIVVEVGCAIKNIAHQIIILFSASILTALEVLCTSTALRAQPAHLRGRSALTVSALTRLTLRSKRQ
ncbi:hypothetical protein BOX15_Mlig001420g6 [Macrostomum lignano]|uniref:SCP domain-containing protein n=1 Tax=Macrostomum lignano TaxID=282301 RepID=A0A267ECS8_9PLAT|nr:hypothetical protein BOX15_Mlig001420g6 [Macrostomum lignano]